MANCIQGIKRLTEEAKALNAQYETEMKENNGKIKDTDCLIA